MSHDEGISNTSGNRPFEEVLRSAQSRRNILKGGLGTATSFFACSSVQALEPLLEEELVGFTPVPLAGGGGAEVRISPDYDYQVLIPWGSRLHAGSSEGIGIGHDGMTYFPVGIDHGVLAINHEYGDNAVVIGKGTPETLHDVRVSQYNHGVSVVELKRAGFGQPWQTANTLGVARRINVNTPVDFSGPVAGTKWLSNPAGNSPKGTVNNCANGQTPWGTYLTCEENFNGYFGATGNWQPTPEQSRYGFAADGFGYGWHLFDPRFNLNDPRYANEDKRFGWIVEIDPMNPDQPPVKRTALGRFKHEGIALTTTQDGRVVGYMGDDERFDYIYKFVSADSWRAMKARGLSPLDEGTLYVARFNEDGSGEWLELSMNVPALAAKFGSLAEILTFARMAADVVGATPMDRPEWTTVAPNGLTYCTLTNNTRRTESDAANPLAPNPDGHIIRWVDNMNEAGTSFVWEVFLMAQDTHGTEESFASPDGLWADPYGRLFIETDGGQADGLNDQLLVADIATGQVKRLLEGVNGCEVTGIATTPDQTTMFVNLQHPSPASGVPRDATLAITRKNGGVIGS